jgi:ATP-dependent DNA helicase DinG
VKLDIEALKKALQPEGIFAKKIPGYLFREEQMELLELVATSLNTGGIALIEAGTGIGKSLAYLIPALLFAYHQKQVVVFSTYTHTLQEQLMFKDIPSLMKALNIEMKVVLVKGMQNYVCHKRLNEEIRKAAQHTKEESFLLNSLSAWSDAGGGDMSLLPFSLPKKLWNKVSVEADLCTQRRCPYYDHCAFIKAREETKQASICVVNHALFLSDRIAKEESCEEVAILPAFSHVILDEGHQFEHVASDLLASTFSFHRFEKDLERLSRPIEGSLSKLKDAFPSKIEEEDEELKKKLLVMLEDKIPCLYMPLLVDLKETQNVLFSYMRENKERLKETARSKASWKEGVLPCLQQLTSAIKRYMITLYLFSEEIKKWKKELLTPKMVEALYIFENRRRRLSLITPLLESFAAEKEEKGHVFWLEVEDIAGHKNCTLTKAAIDISEKVASICIAPHKTFLMLSATLTASGKFSYLKRRLGIDHVILEDKNKIEKKFSSPFNYEKQALFIVPKDMPPPTDPQFTTCASQKILEAIEASNGGAFILFTSYVQLQECYDKLEEALSKKYMCFKQGEMGRSTLLTKFKETQGQGVLFATDTFWQGVDVPGDNLKLVILVKLPFKAPNDPLTEARAEMLTKEGKSPFFYDQLPQALMQFHQGFGRLIRHEKDRGVVVCLDTRLLEKPYGKLFLKTLPNCPKLFVECKDFKSTMTNFYQNDGEGNCLALR